MIKENIVKRGNLNLISNDINQIYLTDLSSGEKKMIILILIALFFDDGILLIDEPEASFSILWQEKLLPTILKYSKLKNVIIATHSPFIASDEDIRKFLIPLPMEE